MRNRVFGASRGSGRKFLSSIVHKLKYAEASKMQPWPKFQVLTEAGSVSKGAENYANLMHSELKKQVYKTMVTTNIMDDIFYSAQRQGRISFYMTSTGEEAAVVGSAAALQPTDEVFAQYREQGLLLWRGFTLDEAANQCFGSEKDPGKGRQMPVHYGKKDINVQTISSPLGTQIPHSVGAAYAMKLANGELVLRMCPSTEYQELKILNLSVVNGILYTSIAEERVSVCFFGDGAASEGDFHSAMNFAATLNCPVLFICRNNGYAISTPTSEQYRGDGVLSRGVGYGIDAIRVDGNDALAVFAAVSDARKRVLKSNSPILVELMTDRRGHHSTSDDSTRYRSEKEFQLLSSKRHPIDRLRGHLEGLKLLTEDEDKNMRDEIRKVVVQSLTDAEKESHLPPRELMEDVYEELPSHLKEQQQELERQLSLYPAQS